MTPSVSSKTQLTRLERTWRFSCHARARVVVWSENSRKWSENTKTVTFFIFLSETKSKTVTPETEMLSVFRKHQKQMFGTKNTSISVEV
jgi:hypothetical protein